MTRPASWPRPRSAMRWMLLVCCALALHFAQGRQNGDPLAVGELVRFHMFVESDYYLTVTACGSFQCGGIRVEGVDAKGMGYWTFQSDARADPRRIKWRTRASPFGTVFLPGREYTFAVYRPTEHEMQLWLEGQEDNMAHVKLDAGWARLSVQYDHGVYRFLGEQEDKSSEPVKDATCPDGTGPEKLGINDLEEKGIDILEVSMGCRYKGDSKTQSLCIAFLAVEGQKSAQEVYRSKVSTGNYDPRLQRKVKIPFKFSEPQILIFHLYDTITDCDIPSEERLLGTLQTPLATVNRNGKVELSLSYPPSGEYSVHFSLNCDEMITLDLSGRKLPGDGDQVYLKIMKSPSGVSGSKNFGFEEVAQTEKVTRDINFVNWNNLTLSVKALCDGDYYRPLKVYALEAKNGSVTLLGSFMTSVNELKRPQSTFLLIDNNLKAQMGDAYNNSGEIYIGEVPQKTTFSQYMRVGFNLVGSLQIDFTASNEEPTPPLHHISEKTNPYQLAIQSVGEIVERFVQDGVFKAYGFGAILPQGTVSFDFYLNLTASNPDCKGVTGVLAAYKETVGKLQLYGPTIFAPAIRKVVDIAREYKDGSKYFVHLLLTDGRLEDPDETKKAILEASALPISIIIVGIGDADLSVLRSMAAPLSKGETSPVTLWNEGERGTRDILQFVAMNDFPFADSDTMKRQLQKKVLNKIPEQYLEYMKINKIPPKTPRNSTIMRVCE